MAQLAVGIDLGHKEVKVAQLRRRRRSHRVERLLRIPVPAQAIAQGRIEARERLRDALRPAFGGLRLEQLHAVVAMKSPEFLVRTLTLPPMPPGELREAARWEMVDLLQLPREQADDLLVDCEVLEQPADGEARVGVVATRRPVVREVVQLLKELRLPPEVLEVNAFALERAVRRPGHVCYLDVGDAFTEVYVASDGRYELYRLLPMGLDRVTAALAEVLGTSREQAEAARQSEELGTLLERSGSHPALRRTVQALLDALAQTLEYVRTQGAQAAGPGDGAVDAIVLSGGGALQPGMAALLHEELGYPVEAADPLQGLELAPQAEEAVGEGLAPLFAPAVGLALRGVEGP
ncbi:MAG: type IV pilus assembly protein PilM [Limnochordaceae bacterium]|nr:type IV pilus assembly protein PilM [Limnochordaceae bacterium]